MPTLNNKAHMIGIVLGICLVVVSLFAYSQIAALQRSASAAETSNATLLSQIDALQTQITSLQSQISSLQSQLSTANANNAALQDQITSLDAEIETLTAENVDLQSQITALEESIDSVNAENLLLKEQLYEMSMGWVEKARYDRSLLEVTAQLPR